jgi:hypothetical protein
MYKAKKSFKIVLDSNNTDSWTGNLYKANYYLDLTQIIQNNDDFFKSYYMYCSFISKADDVTNNLITPAKVYTLHIDMGKGLNVYEYKSIKTPSFILPVEVINSVVGGAEPDTRFYLLDYQQQPTVIPNILNLNTIQIQVIDTSTDSTTASNANYVCVLTFVEC